MRLFPIFGLTLLIACAQTPDPQTGNSEQTEPQEQQITPPKTQKVAQLSLGEMEEAKSNYLVPSPGEILSSLDKLDKVAWSQLASYETKADYDDKYGRALNLGVRVADAFMAINARDAAKFGEMSTIIFDLAREIGLGDVLEGQRTKLDGLASEGRWEELQAALDDVQTDVRNEVEAMGEDELVVLASAGGWLEGMRVVSAHLKDNYAEDKAGLLLQSGMIDYFRDEFATMPEGARSHPLVAATEKCLQDIAPMVQSESPADAAGITGMYESTNTLIDRIERGN